MRQQYTTAAANWTLGMAVYDRPPHFYESTRAYFTVMQSIIHHPKIKEVVVVDNNPHPQNTMLRELPIKTKGRVRYVEMPEPVGTAAPRNRVFEVARTDYVAVVDPHVVLYPGFFDSLDAFYEERGSDCPDLLHGPMMTEAGELYATHMNDQWREEMLGTWAWAWEKVARNSVGEVYDPQPNGFPLRFSAIDPGDHICHFVSLDPTYEQVELAAGDYGLPQNLSWYGHEKILQSLGFRQPEKPFPIPGHGMGFFACRKDSWLPFHQGCRGFGGEEITTGYRFRQAGRKAWSLPGVKWWHHFHRPQNQVPYRLTVYDKVRNYCLEFARLGLDLQPVHDHFFKGKNRPESEWEQAKRGVEWPKPSGDMDLETHAATPQESHARQIASGRQVGLYQGADMKPRTQQTQQLPQGIEGFYRASLTSAGPLTADLPHLRHLAATCGEGDDPGRVVEIVHNSVSCIALVAGKPDFVESYGSMPPHRVKSMQERSGDTAYNAFPGIPERIDDCDLLFLDVDPHTSDYYRLLLERYHANCKRYVAIHDTVVYGETWNGEPGLWPAVKQFLTDHPEWHVVGHHTTQNGLMILSRNLADKDKVTAPPELFAGVQAPVVQGQMPQQPSDGVGTQLKLLLASLGINPSPDCSCNARAMEMDRAGVGWVKDNKHAVVGWLKEGAPRWGWTDWAKAVYHATVNGLAFKLNPLDPFPGLVDEAVRRYEDKQKESAA